MVLPAHLQRHILGQHVARLADPPLAGEHLSRQDQRLRPGPAFHQTPKPQQLIGTLLHYSSGLVPSDPSVRCTRASTRASTSASFASQWRRSFTPRSNACTAASSFSVPPSRPRTIWSSSANASSNDNWATSSSGMVREPLQCEEVRPGLRPGPAKGPLAPLIP